MQNVSRPEGSRRSAFAAAFLSFLFPGLGQAYAGRYGRALAFAALPIVLIALLAGVLANEEARRSFLFGFANPSTLLAALAVNVLLLVYRGVAVVDAYRVANAGSAVSEASPRARRRTRLHPLSIVGLVAILLVLGGGHAAAAQYNLLAYEFITALSGDEEGPTATPTRSPSNSPPGSPEPGSSEPGESGATGDPSTAPATPSATATGTPQPQPTEGPAWNGTERLNILLVGGDSRDDAGATGLTDTMIVASIDPTTNRVAMLSLPRDTESVPFPPGSPAAAAYAGGVYPTKINTLWANAANRNDLFPGNSPRQRGANALKSALGELYGLDIKYYVSVNFEGFRSVIQELGGVVIDVQLPVADDKYPTDDGRGSLNLYIPAGIQHMDQNEALAYARARHQSTDFDRSQRQQRVITSLRQQTDLGSLLDIRRLRPLVDAFENTVHTDIPADQFQGLIELASRVDLDRMRSLVFSPPFYQVECLECYSLSPRVDVIRDAVTAALAYDEALEARREALEAEGGVVWVLKGSAVERQARLWADYLAATGMDADVPRSFNQGRADSLTYTETVISVYNGAETTMPETIAVLEEVFGVAVETVADPSIPADVIVITGSDTVALPGTGE